MAFPCFEACAALVARVGPSRPRLRDAGCTAAMGAPVSGTYVQPWEARIVAVTGSSSISGIVSCG